MDTDKLTNPTVKAGIDPLQSGDRKTWAALFEADAGKIERLDIEQA